MVDGRVGDVVIGRNTLPEGEVKSPKSREVSEWANTLNLDTAGTPPLLLAGSYEVPFEFDFSIDAVGHFLIFLYGLGVMGGAALLDTVAHKGATGGHDVNQLIRDGENGEAKLGDIPVHVVAGEEPGTVLILPQKDHEGAFQDFARRQVGDKGSDSQYVAALVSESGIQFLTLAAIDAYQSPAGFTQLTPEEDPDEAIERITEWAKENPDHPIVVALGLTDPQKVRDFIEGVELPPGPESINLDEAGLDNITVVGEAENPDEADETSQPDPNDVSRQIEAKLREMKVGDTIIVSSDASKNPDVLAPEGTPGFSVTVSNESRYLERLRDQKSGWDAIIASQTSFGLGRKR